MKRVLAFILSLTMVLCLVPAISFAEEPTITPIKDVREEIAAGTTGREYTVKGTVTYVYSNKEVYLQDADGYGICAYLSTADSTVVAGNLLTVTGTTMVHGTALPELGSATVVSNVAGTAVTPTAVSLADIAANSAKYLCTLVKFDATVKSYDTNSNPTLTDGTNDIAAYRVSLDTTAIPVGSEVTCELVVSAFNAVQFRGLASNITLKETEPELPPPSSPPTESGKIIILTTNDVHTYIGEAMSYASVAALKAELTAAGNDVLLADAGDHVQGTAYGAMDEGATIIKLMNAAGYDIATFGNHEFDYGMTRALEFCSEANFSYLSCNFMDLVNNKQVLDSYKIFTIGEGEDAVKVAFVGITTPESITKSTPAYFMDNSGNYIYGIEGGTDGAKLYAAVQTAVDAAKADGADYVVALAHTGIDTTSEPWTSYNVIANTTGIDAYIDGHSHSTAALNIGDANAYANKDGDDVPYVQGGQYFENIGKVTIDPASGEVTVGLISSYENVDAAIKTMQDTWISEIDDMLGEVIAYTFDDLRISDYEGKRMVRSVDCNAGDLSADALYYLFNVTEGLDCDVAFMNGGGVRANTPAGFLSYKSAKTIHTFGNVACLMTVTGQQIQDALEWGARATTGEHGANEVGGFLHVAGLTYEVNTAITSTVQYDENTVWTGAPTGKYRVQNVQILNKDTGSYEPIDLSASYNLGGYNYTIRQMGDGFNMFDGAVLVKDYVMEDYMVLANYFKSFAKQYILYDAATGVYSVAAKLTDANKDKEVAYLPVVTGYSDYEGDGRITFVNEEAPVVTPTYDYSLEAPTAYTDAVEVEMYGGKYLKVDIKLNHTEAFNDTVLLSSTGFTLKYDSTKLVYVTDSKTLGTIYTYRLIENAFTHVMEKVYSGSYSMNTGVAGEIRFALATDYGLYLEDGDTLYTVYFKLADGAADGDEIPLELSESSLGLVVPGVDEGGAHVEPDLDPTTYSFGLIDGLLTVGSESETPVVPAEVDKSQLQKAYDYFNGWMNYADLAVVSNAADANKLPDGTMYVFKNVKTALVADLVKALALLNNSAATQQQVDDMTLYLNNTYKDFLHQVKVDTSALETAIANAEAFIASEEFKACSEALQNKWTKALDAAKAALANQEHTQNQVDAAANALNNLRKTGESTVVFVFAGMAILAAAGLAVVLRRRYNH